MSSDKKNIKKILAVSAGAVGTAFVCTRLLAQKKNVSFLSWMRTMLKMRMV